MVACFSVVERSRFVRRFWLVCVSFLFSQVAQFFYNVPTVLTTSFVGSLIVINKRADKYIICLQIKFYAAIETLFEFLHNVDRGREHGIEGIVLKFESKMAFTTNVVVTEHRIMAGAFMILLTHNFFIDPPPPHSCLVFVLR